MGVLKNITDKITKGVVQNISQIAPRKTKQEKYIIPEQLYRVTKDIQAWRDAVLEAESIDYPDRETLMEYYKDFVDDYQIWSGMQTRINKSISGSFRILNESGEIDKDEMSKFIDPKGFPLPWFRDFIRIAIESKFYGFEVIQLGDIVDDTFTYAKKIPEQNTVPFYFEVIKDIRRGWHKENTISLKEEPFKTWLVPVGSKTDLGLINKCAPYSIYKQAFGSWAQHADIFGMPLRIGRTNLIDNERKENMIQMFEQMEAATYGIFDPDDTVEFIEQKGSSDPHNIYGKLIDKCDSAIAKILLGQTGTTDEKAFSGSADVHQDILEDIIFADKLDIASVVNTELIPRMKKLGMIESGKKVFGAWDFSEKINKKDWSVIFKNLSLFYNVPEEEIERTMGVIVEPKVEFDDEGTQNKMALIMNELHESYKEKINISDGKD